MRNYLIEHIDIEISISYSQFNNHKLVVIYKIVGIIVIYKVFCLDVAQGRMDGALNETQTHSWRFVSQACQPLHYLRRPNCKYYNCYYAISFKTRVKI